MHAESGTPPTANRPNITAGILKRVASVAIFLVFIALVLFLASGRPAWTWAWVYLGISVVTLLINAMIMLPTHAETVAERGELKITQKWDKIVSGLYALAMYFALPLVAGLDVRFGWTGDLGLAWHIAGAVVLALGVELSAWAMIANAYFSTAVRIQSERGHAVCDGGPYRFVRHPGYVGFILHALSLPFLLGSLWALVPGIIASASLIVRTSLEDRTLQADLAGYPDYVQKVRFRLLPGVW
jgi:protein-S-isoprenylcysteine O-methyltransferase Ste14